MRHLTNYALNDVISEWIGPVTGRNYNVAQVASPVAAAVEIQVIGSGAVKLQTNTTAIFRGARSGDSNAFTFDRVPDPNSGWSDVGIAINAASGKVSRAVTADPSACFLRLIVTTAGTGTVLFKSVWN